MGDTCMIDQVAAAFERGDYKAAAKLLKPLFQQSPEDPWVQLYVGRLQEACHKPDGAERTYRQLLRETANPKVAIQARQGLQRLEAAAQEQRQTAIAQATADPENNGAGFLVLEPVTGDDRAKAVQSFARVMKLDPYTARLQLPSRSWRLYRTGAIGELQVYGQELLQAGIPVFWRSLDELKKIRVFRVQYMQSVSPQAIVVCQNEADQLGSLAFDWSEVANRVDGMLPIFEDVVDINAWKKLQRKEQTRDYAQVCDLHLPERNCILRFCDNTYDFQQGVVFYAPQEAGAGLVQATKRINWNHLLSYVDRHTKTASAWSGFTAFAETALEHLDLVSQFPSHIDLFRKEETNWDRALQLYSSLVFLKPKT
jgi:tetratricopeptide (TPR) repeat protein